MEEVTDRSGRVHRPRPLLPRRPARGACNTRSYAAPAGRWLVTALRQLFFSDSSQQQPQQPWQRRADEQPCLQPYVAALPVTGDLGELGNSNLPFANEEGKEPFDLHVRTPSRPL